MTIRRLRKAINRRRVTSDMKTGRGPRDEEERGEEENQQKQILFENALINVNTSIVYANSKLSIYKNLN